MLDLQGIEGPRLRWVAVASIVAGALLAVRWLPELMYDGQRMQVFARSGWQLFRDVSAFPAALALVAAVFAWRGSPRAAWVAVAAAAVGASNYLAEYGFLRIVYRAFEIDAGPSGPQPRFRVGAWIGFGIAVTGVVLVVELLRLVLKGRDPNGATSPIAVGCAASGLGLGFVGRLFVYETPTWELDGVLTFCVVLSALQVTLLAGVALASRTDIGAIIGFVVAALAAIGQGTMLARFTKEIPVMPLLAFVGLSVAALCGLVLTFPALARRFGPQASTGRRAGV